MGEPRRAQPRVRVRAGRGAVQGGLRDRARGPPCQPRRCRALADPRLRRSAHLPAAHHPALRTRAGADRRRAGSAPILPVAWRDGMQPPARRRAAFRRARVLAGRPLGRRRVRLLPELCAGLPDRRAAVGGDGGGARARARTICAVEKWSRSRAGWPSTCTATGGGWTRCPWSSKPRGAGWRWSRSCGMSLRWRGNSGRATD